MLIGKALTLAFADEGYQAIAAARRIKDIIEGLERPNVQIR